MGDWRRGALIMLPALLLSGCTGATHERSAAPSPSPSAAPSPSTTVSAPASRPVLLRIPSEVRAGVLAGAPVSRPRGCDRASVLPSTVGDRVSAVAEAVSAAGQYRVTRRLTVYRSVRDARDAVHRLRRPRLVLCPRLGGREVIGVEASDWIHLPSALVHVPQHDETLYRNESVLARGHHAIVWVDVVAREDNAVMITHVLDPSGDEGVQGVVDSDNPFRRTVARLARR